MNDVDLNWLAVLAAAVVPMALGAMWYSPVLFADRWLRAVGRSPESVGGAAHLYGIAALASLVISLVLAVVAGWAGADSVVDGLLIGLLLWGGFVATTSLVSSSFAGRPLDLWAMDAGYYLVSLAGMGAIHGAWH